MPPLDILYEDNHLLVVNKPAGMATMGAESGPTVHALAAAYLKQAYDKPGKAYVGIVSRLDTMTSGVLVLARTSKAAVPPAVRSSRTNRMPERPRCTWPRYPASSSRSGANWWTLSAKTTRRGGCESSTVRSAVRSGRNLRYATIAAQQDVSMLAVRIVTGRKHQIRLQLAERGHPVIGDRKYGSTRAFSAGVALHSWRLQIMHPTKRQRMWFQADVPPSWRPFRGLMPEPKDLSVLVGESLDLPSDDAP